MPVRLFMQQFFVPDYILFIIGALNLILSIFIFANNPKCKINQSFAIFAFFISFWPITLFLYRNAEIFYAEFWMKTSYLAAAGIALSFWLFVHYFPIDVPRTVLNRTTPLIITLALISLFFIPNFLTSGVYDLPNGTRMVNSEWCGHSVFALYFITFFFGAILLLWHRFKMSEGIIKQQSRILFFGILGSGIFGTIFNLVLPSPYFNNFNYIYVGPFFTFLFVLAVSYAVARHQLMNIKAIATEFFVVIMFLISVLKIFFTDSRQDFFLQMGFAGLILMLGAFLIHSVENEVKRREEMSKLAKSLEDANCKLQELDRQKTEFLSIASHQLRTPLSIIKGYIELIEDGAYGKTTKQMTKTLDDMDESNERLVKMVDEFLDITRIEQGRTKYNFENKKINDIIDSVIKELLPKAEAKHLKVVINYKTDKTLVSVDEEKVRHVVFNFVDNAIKYTESGNFNVFVEELNGGLALKVQDHGIGFDKVDEVNFFQKFYRGENVKGTNVNGTGLGIYVCKKFIENHGGMVWAHSSGLGKGSEFGFWIPYERPDSVAANGVVDK